MANAEAGYGTHKRRDLNGRVMRFKESGDNFMVNARSTNRNFTSADEDNILNSVNLSASKKVKEGLDLSGNFNYTYNRNGSQSGTYNEQYLSDGNQYALAEKPEGVMPITEAKARAVPLRSMPGPKRTRKLPLLISRR